MRPQLVANKEKENHAEDDGYDFQGPIFALQHPVSFPVRIALVRHAESPLLVARRRTAHVRTCSASGGRIGSLSSPSTCEERTIRLKGVRKIAFALSTAMQELASRHM